MASARQRASASSLPVAPSACTGGNTSAWPKCRRVGCVRGALCARCGFAVLRGGCTRARGRKQVRAAHAGTRATSQTLRRRGRRWRRFVAGARVATARHNKAIDADAQAVRARCALLFLGAGHFYVVPRLERFVVTKAPHRPLCTPRCVRRSASASHVAGRASIVSGGERATTRKRVVASGRTQCLHGRQRIGKAEASPRGVRVGRTPQALWWLCWRGGRLLSRAQAQAGSCGARGHESHVPNAAKVRALVASFGFSARGVTARYNKAIDTDTQVSRTACASSPVCRSFLR